MSQKIDITSSFNALISLESWLKIPGERILQYVFLNKATYSAENFIEKFCIKEKTLLEDNLDIVSLHVTTNNDNCNAIKKYGLLNLQEAIIMDTPISNYIKAYGVLIDLNNKVIEYQGNTYDISKRYIRAIQGSKESHLDMVVYKLFKDYQINGFICHRNALTYGGGVSYRPEFLCNLANALGNANIENYWYKNKNECYVLKYWTDLAQLSYETFNLTILNNQDYFENIEEFELDKRRWVLENALKVMADDTFGFSLPELIAYFLYDAKVPAENIEIFTSNEYKAAYEIKDRF